MELSSIFLMMLENGVSADSVKNALNACNLEMIQRMGTFEEEEEVIDTFFKDKNDLDTGTNAFQEMMDFKNTCEKYLDMLSEKERQGIWILQVAEEVEGVYHDIKNRELLSNMTERQLQAVDSLCREIQGVCEGLSIAFMVKEKTGLVIKNEFPLEEFQDNLISFNYLKIQNQIIETMKTGGIAFVTTGAGAYTREKIYEFILFENGWIKVHI